MIFVRRARRFSAWLAVCCALLVPCLVPGAVTAQSLNAAPSSGYPSAGIHGVVKLDGPWRFQMGDDSRYADPKFNDTSWQPVTLGKSLSEQGFEIYAGYAWYRLRLDPTQLQFGNLSGNAPIEVMVTSHTIGQLAVFINGVEAGHTAGMTDKPAMYQSSPFVVPLPRVNPGEPIVIAVRSWAGPGIPISHGLLESVEVGAHPDVIDRLDLAIARHWDDGIIAEMVLVFLFIGVALLGAVLYMAQRHHSEYLWLSLMCLGVTLTGCVELAGALAVLNTALTEVLTLWTGRLFMAATLEFVLRFTATEKRQVARIFQISVLALPLVSLVGLAQLYEALSISSQVIFCGLVTWLLFRSWRRGFREAGIMLVPFFLAATADSIDTVLEYASMHHWLSDKFSSHHFYIGPIQITTGIVTYAVFLSSLIAVILYRFVKVSQEEQRSAAEMAAARSVQAMLIPTELPSNQFFVLESAYIPANGVGGDFFQVLPVEDGSMMVVVGDVSGKGLQAAMNASTLVGAFRNELSHEPATVLNHLNTVLLGATSGARDKDAVVSFATCLCARIFRDGTMTVANAGHLSPYREGRELELPPGLPLGVIAGLTYEQVSVTLQQGERLIFLSDGVVEATNDRGELFGFERTQQVSNEPARYIAQTAKRFGQNDDITVISVYIAAREERLVEELEVALPR